MSKTSTVSFVSLASSIGQNLGALKSAETKALMLKDIMNQAIAELHAGKVKVGTYKKDGTGCAIATAFIDGCEAGGLTQSTAQKTYLPTFKAAVASGKPVTDWNGQRAKGKGKGKGGKASEPKTLANKLATCFRDADFASFVTGLQQAYDDADIDNLIDGIKSYLEAEGIEIKDAE
jgi:hypothetical protein